MWFNNLQFVVFDVDELKPPGEYGVRDAVASGTQREQLKKSLIARPQLVAALDWSPAFRRALVPSYSQGFSLNNSKTLCTRLGRQRDRSQLAVITGHWISFLYCCRRMICREIIQKNEHAHPDLFRQFHMEVFCFPNPKESEQVCSNLAGLTPSRNFSSLDMAPAQTKCNQCTSRCTTGRDSISSVVLWQI